ncbi:MAG: flagellar biosynthesis protein FlhB [Povalibacter sp.]
MAENEDGQERTESATPKRLEEARQKGQIPRSRDLTAAAVLMTAGVALSSMGGQIGGALSSLMSRGLTLTRDQALDSTQMIPTLVSTAKDGLMATLPVLGLMMLAALLAPLALGGWSFSTEALMPQFSRLNPLTGVKRLFEMRALVELLKALAKFGVVAVIAGLVLWKDASAMLALGREPTTQAILHAIQITGSAMIRISAGMLVIAGIDVPYQLWQYAKQLKMTREEVRREMKESEGSPEVKGRIRQLQQEMARSRMMQDVPKADVIVTNPTHFAVALKYDAGMMHAPRVVAKGQDFMAQRIREIAIANGIPILERPPLARSLYKMCEIGQEIPEQFYSAVAEILAYVYEVSGKVRQAQPALN